jgi:hypothetical protein
MLMMMLKMVGNQSLFSVRIYSAALDAMERHDARWMCARNANQCIEVCSGDEQNQGPEPLLEQIAVKRQRRKAAKEKNTLVDLGSPEKVCTRAIPYEVLIPAVAVATMHTTASEQYMLQEANDATKKHLSKDIDLDEIADEISVPNKRKRKSSDTPGKSPTKQQMGWEDTLGKSSWGRTPEKESERLRRIEAIRKKARDAFELEDDDDGDDVDVAEFVCSVPGVTPPMHTPTMPLFVLSVFNVLVKTW